jgi:signal transduction histidine kinase
LLHPPLLDELGLKSAILLYVEGFTKRSEIRVDLQLPEIIDRLPSEVETALFRVVQQSLSNIHRHSGSSSASISLNLMPNGVEVKIVDRGCGIPPNTLAAFNTGEALLGVGVAGMRERIRNMGGRFLVESGETGTIVQAALPVSW